MYEVPGYVYIFGGSVQLDYDVALSEVWVKKPLNP